MVVVVRLHGFLAMAATALPPLNLSCHRIGEVNPRLTSPALQLPRHTYEGSLTAGILHGTTNNLEPTLTENQWVEAET